ncbi:MAG: PspA/IM30 family protein [Nostocaceae cyanobacterium]|nr:PspA/IM30 family protein [Nostocaceae cyanobacterium]
MALIDRILSLVRANLNSLTTKAEDPETILEQTVNQMQEDLLHLRQAVAVAIATQKRTERQATQAQSHAHEYYRRAQLALQAGNEQLARLALTKRKSYHETASAMWVQIQQQQSIVGRLKKDLQSLEGKLAQARAKKDMYIARSTAAQASANINEMLAGINPKGFLYSVEQLEEKVQQLEAQSQALAELTAVDLKSSYSSPLASRNHIDAELTALKVQMLNDTPSQPQQLPNS